MSFALPSLDGGTWLLLAMVAVALVAFVVIHRKHGFAPDLFERRSSTRPALDFNRAEPKPVDREFVEAQAEKTRATTRSSACFACAVVCFATGSPGWGIAFLALSILKQ